MRRTDPLIVGGGPAACSAAILLAGAGAQPLVLERTREPHDIVCGGFMSADTIGLLARIGLQVDRLGAHRLNRLRILSGDRVFEAELPFAACGLSRRRLDAALIERAAAAGAGVERGIAATRMDADARRVHLADGSALSAEAILLATGKADLRGAGRPQGRGEGDPPVGLRARMDPAAALRATLHGVIELHVFRGGYAGLLLLEDGSVNLCLSVAKSRLAQADKRPDVLIAALAAENAHFADRMGGALSLGNWSTIANIPYGWRAEPDRAGIFRLGDQGAVIASLAGDGIGIALASGAMAAAAWQSGGAGASATYQTALRARSRRPLKVASGLRWLAEHPFAHGPAMTLIARVPGLMRFAAAATRIGEEA